MHAKYNRPSDPQISLTKIVLFSLIPGGIFGFISYVFFEWIILSYKITLEELNYMYAIVSSVIFYLLSIYIGITYGRILYRRTNSKSLHHFRNFSESLQSNPGEKALFQILHKYISNISNQVNVSIFYKHINSEENDNWIITPQNAKPVCVLDSKSCPVICNGKECFVNDIQNDLTCAYQLPAYTNGSYICLLLNLKDSPVCVVQLYHREKNYFDIEFVNDVRASLEALRPVIERKNMLNELNLEVYTDKLTQVKNRTYLEQEFGNLIENSSNSNEPFSIIIADIDFFKKVNDSFGHPAGDCILIEFSKILSNCVRVNDIVCRYGGEEFLILLPNSNIAYAKAIAERIRKTISLTKMPVFQGVQLPKITCSLGVSTFPDYASDKVSLIKTADLALYSAKHSGRNMVVCFDPYNPEIPSM
jgi:diguanylate cyclase (GGDEF)-like protein